MTSKKITSEQALNTIKNYLLKKLKEDNSELGSLIIKENVKVIEEKLNELEKRDTPMKTTKVVNTNFIFWCRKCDCSSIQRYDNFCHKCGQRLDWGEKEND